MSAFSEAAEILDQIPLDASAPKHAPIPQLTMSPKEALAWAKAVDLNRVSAFTKMQKDEIADIFIQTFNDSYIYHSRLALWSLPYMRSNTRKKMAKAGFLETWDQARVRSPEDDEWAQDIGMSSTAIFCSPIGEQVAAALFLSSHGEELFLESWEKGAAIRSTVLAERDALRKQNEAHKLRDERIREIASKNSSANEALHRVLDHRNARNALPPATKQPVIRSHLHEPMIQLTYDQLADIMGEKLPPKRPDR